MRSLLKYKCDNTHLGICYSCSIVSPTTAFW
nr:MAG TPA: hypothetical protein [Caudoviricetes sp.]